MKSLYALILAACVSLEMKAQCNDFYPLKENARLEYDMYDRKEKLGSRMSYTMKDITGSGDNMTAVLVQEIYDPKNGEKLTSSELNWRCEKGTLHFDMKSMTFGTDNSQQMNMVDAGMGVDVTGDQMDLPSDLSVGQTLKDVSYHIKMTMGNVPIMNRTYHVKDRRVESQEQVTTPAGTFDCYKMVFITTDDKGRNSIKSAIWYAKDAGMVKAENYNEDGKMMNRQLLVKLVR
jgi:hypothetical protein